MATGLANSTSVSETLTGERIIRTQLGRAGRYVKWVEAGSQLLTLSIGILLFFLTAALIDHWLFSLGWAGRWLFCLALIGGSGWFIARRLLPLLVRAVNPTYSARVIEEATPSLKNSLINFLLLKDNHAGVKESVIDALQQRAAKDISTIEVETTIDREPLIRMGYVLCGVLSVVAVYKIASPKDPFQTAARVIAPWADLARPSRVIISEVQPGHKSVYLGSKVEVTADVQGARGSDGVRLIYSSADGQVHDRVIVMKASAGGRKFVATLPAEDAARTNSKTSAGLQQGVQYHIEAGDAVSSIYEIRVRLAPTIAVAKAELTYPAYTLKAATTQETGEIKALEGTRVTIHAHANQPIKTAFLELDPRPGRAAETIPLQVAGQQASGSFTLQLKPDRVSPWRESYQVRFTNELGEISEQPVVHRLEVIADLPPEVEILAPRQQRVDLPEDGQLTIELRGVDPDFALSELFVLGKLQGQPLFRQSVLPAGESRSQASGKFEFAPAKLNLKAGTIVTYQGVAIDNRRDPLTGQSQPGRAETAEYAIHIVPPPRRNPNDANNAPQPNNQPNEPNQQPKPAGGNEQPMPMPGEKPPMNPAGENQPPMPGEQKPPMPGEKPPMPKPGEENQQQKPKQPQDEPKQGGQKSGEPSPGQSGSGQGEASKGQGNQPQPGQGQGGQNNSKPGDKPPMPGEGQTGQDAGQSGSGQSQPGQNQPGQGGSKTQPPNGAQPPPTGSGNTPGNPNGQGADPGSEGNPEGTPGEQTGQQGGNNAQPGSGKPQHDGEIVEKVMEKLRDQLKENQKKEGAGKGNNDKPKPGEQQPNDSADPAGQNQPGNDSQSKQPGGKPTAAKPGAGKPENDQAVTEQQLKDIEQMLKEQQAKGQPKPGTEAGKPNETAPGDQADPMGAGQKPMPGQPMPMPGQPMGAGQQGTPQNGAGQKPEATKSGSPQGPPRTDEGQQPSPAQGVKKQPGAGKNGDPGAGDQSKDPTGSGPGEGQNRDQPKDMNSGNSPAETGEPSAPSNSKKQSNSKGGASGDQSGGGKQGAGQSGGQKGNDSAGGSSAGDEGAGAAQEQGKGETGSKAGKGPEAAGKTGESGNKPGQGSATKPSQDGNETGKGGEPGKQPGKKGENEPGGSNAGGDRAGPGGPTGGGAGDRSGQGITKSSADVADEANLNYTRKATDLVLQHLRDQEHNPDPELAKKVQLTPQELQEFARRWSQLKKDAETDPSKARELDEALRSLGLKDPQNRRRSGGTVNDKVRDLRDTGSRTQAPNKYREQFDKFRKAAGQ